MNEHIAKRFIEDEKKRVDLEQAYYYEFLDRFDMLFLELEKLIDKWQKVDSPLGLERTERYTELLNQLQDELDRMIKGEIKRFNSFLIDQIDDTIKKDLYIIDVYGANVIDFNMIDFDTVRILLLSEARPDLYMERRLSTFFTDPKRRTEFLESLKDEQLKMAVIGQSFQQTFKNLVKHYKEVDARYIRTVIRTEASIVRETAHLKAREITGADYWYWSAVLESRTCSYCAKMDGKKFKNTEETDTIPAHPNCRCLSVPAVRGGSRAGRQYTDPETGEKHFLDEFLTFEEWAKKVGLK